MKGCDFVFDKNYNMMPWQEKELFYKTQKHLPNIDPASVMETAGLDVSKNFAGLLQNSEEDRLDITELYKRMEKVEKQNEELQKENVQLKKEMETLKKK